LLALASLRGRRTAANCYDTNPVESADLISGGSALVEIRLPGFVSATKMKVDIDSADVTSSFTTLANGRVIGLVTGLKNGVSNLNVTSTDGSFGSGQARHYHHPIGGPVLLSAQTSPWICATPVPVVASGSTPASNASGLSTTATDAQCNIATEYKLFYRTMTPVDGRGRRRRMLVRPAGSQPDDRQSEPGDAANSCFQPYVAGSTPAAGGRLDHN